MSTHAVPKSIAVLFHRGIHSQHLKLEILRLKFLEERIGVGAFSFVEAVEVSGKIYAGKRFRDDSDFNGKTFIREFQIMQALKHDHITMGITCKNVVHYQLNPGLILQVPKTDSLISSVYSPLIVCKTELLGAVKAWE